MSRAFLRVVSSCGAAGIVALAFAASALAQGPAAAAQELTGRLRPGEIAAFQLVELAPGDHLSARARATSGNLDPFVGVVSADADLREVVPPLQADVAEVLARGTDIAAGLDEVRDRYLVAWDDDGGEGYAADLEWDVTTPGSYWLFVGPSLSAVGRVTAGDFVLDLGLTRAAAAPATQPTTSEAPTGSASIASIARAIPNPLGPTQAVQIVTGTLTADAPTARVRLEDLAAGDTLYARVESAGGEPAPALVLEDFGGKPLEASLSAAASAAATIEHTVSEPTSGLALKVGAPPGGAAGGDFRLAVGLNAPDVAGGGAQPRGPAVVVAPITVQAGLRINRISAVDSQDENFTVLASIRMDWTDPRLAFSPDSCGCAVKVYTEKEFDRFVSDVESRWPAFTFFNQLGNRWVISKAAAIWPDGRARYAESFSTTFQADFDFRDYPFDTESFPVFLDLLYPTDQYVLTELPGYSAIDPEHGEDEFVITDFTATPSTAAPSAADQPVSRMTFNFDAPRHLQYYILQLFVPIGLIIMISWFTFFLKDYTKRIEAAAANVLLFIAFSFSLADNYPRLGYITFLDAIMTVTFVVNVLVLIYNVNMKRLENKGTVERIEQVDTILDWAYPLIYVVLFGLVVVIFF